MNISYETTQQYFTYLIEFFGFVALFLLPCEYIIKCHVETVNGWGKPGERHIDIPNPAQTSFKNQTKKEATPIKQKTNESEKPTITKSQRKKNTELVTA